MHRLIRALRLIAVLAVDSLAAILDRLRCAIDGHDWFLYPGGRWCAQCDKSERRPTT